MALDTELLLGVFHHPQFLSPLVKFIDKEYLGGPSSMMLEIPPNPDRRFGSGFFDRLEERYSARGSKIIYGDRYLPMPKIVPGLLRDFYNGEMSALKACFSFPFLLASAALLYSFVLMDLRTTKIRDRGMLRALEEENPQLVILGARHTTYLKKEHPEIPHKIIIPSRFKRRVDSSGLFSNADEVLTFE